MLYRTSFVSIGYGTRKVSPPIGRVNLGSSTPRGMFSRYFWLDILRTSEFYQEVHWIEQQDNGTVK